MGRAPCCDKATVKKGPWSPEEDARLKAYINQFGTGNNWIALPQKIGLKRCGKSCRLRWLNYLRPNIKHGGFSDEEDNIICSLYISIGSRWSIIAAQLPGRTDNDIKNYWNTRLKKKLLGRRRHSNRSSASIQEPTDINGVENLSSTAMERLQLHMQLQGLQNPFSFYTNPALWPKLNPLQENLIHQSLQHSNDSSTPNPNPKYPLMQNLYHSPPSGDVKSIEAYQPFIQDYTSLVSELEISTNGMSSGCKQSNHMQINPISTFQAEVGHDFLMNNNQMGDFECFKELNSFKNNGIWWSNDLDTISASSNSWDSNSVQHHQSSGESQDLLFIQNCS